MRYKFEPSENPNHWVATDIENKIVCVFEHKKFNETQKITMLDDFDANNYMQLAKYMRELGDWLTENHRDKLY